MRIAHAVLFAASLAACLDDDKACTEDGCEDGLMNAAHDEANTAPKADGYDCSGVRVPDRGGFGKRIGLTFDDGPNPATTPRVIEILKRHRAPATFFNNGMRYSSQAAKDLAAQIAADPDYILGNHSQNHLNLATVSAAKFKDEVDRTDVLVRAAGETPKYFRFPFGSATCDYKKSVEARGYHVVGWHIDSADWCYAAGNGYCKKSTFQYVDDNLRDDMQGYVMQQARANSGGIILFHDIHAHTADHLDAILTALEAEGFTFVRLDDTTVFPRLNGLNPKFIGESCGSDADCMFAGGACHPAGFCTQACAGTCPDASGKAPTFCIADARAADAGMCVAKAASQNGNCLALPNTELRNEPRFIGASSSPPATADVCAPR
jgi:peptidoglycan/xylan/chitin deacetylase (PgdA/CDA1 family)